MQRAVQAGAGCCRLLCSPPSSRLPPALGCAHRCRTSCGSQGGSRRLASGKQHIAAGAGQRMAEQLKVQSSLQAVPGHCPSAKQLPPKVWMSPSLGPTRWGRWDCSTAPAPACSRHTCRGTEAGQVCGLCCLCSNSWCQLKPCAVQGWPPSMHTKCTAGLPWRGIGRSPKRTLHSPAAAAHHAADRGAVANLEAAHGRAHLQQVERQCHRKGGARRWKGGQGVWAAAAARHPGFRRPDNLCSERCLAALPPQSQCPRSHGLR